MILAMLPDRFHAAAQAVHSVLCML